MILAAAVAILLLCGCSCAPVEADCPNTGDYSKSTSFMIPQYFFDDGITRYNQLIQEQLQAFCDHQFGDQSFSIDKCKHGTLHASQLHARRLDVTDLQIKISDGNTVHLTFTAAISGTCPGEATYGLHIHVLFVDFCITLDSCGGEMTYTATVQFNIVVNLVVDSSCALSVQASVATANFVSQNLDGCSVPNWLESILSAFGFNIQQIVNQVVEAIAQQLIQDITGSLYLPSEASLGNNVFIAYEVSKLEVIPDEHILVYVDTRLRAIPPGSTQSVVYHDTAWPDRFAIRPWDNYSMHPAADEYITSEARISDEVLHGYLWANQQAGLKSAYGSIQILDANITINMTWNMMDFNIPQNNLMLINLDYGVVTGMCGQKIALEVTFTNLTGTAQMYTTQNSQGDTGLYLQITAWYQDTLNITLILPEIMLPASFIQDLIRDALTSCIDDINTILSNNILYLPSSIAPYAPNQQVELIVQPGCCNNNHGFLQLSIHCTCSGDKHFKPCSNLCTTERRRRREAKGRAVPLVAIPSLPNDRSYNSSSLLSQSLAEVSPPLSSPALSFLNLSSGPFSTAIMPPSTATHSKAVSIPSNTQRNSMTSGLLSSCQSSSFASFIEAASRSSGRDSSSSGNSVAVRRNVKGEEVVPSHGTQGVSDQKKSSRHHPVASSFGAAGLASILRQRLPLPQASPPSHYGHEYGQFTGNEDTKHANLETVSDAAAAVIGAPSKKEPHPETILIMYNTDGSTVITSSTLFYSYFAEGACVWTPSGFFERISIIMDVSSGVKTATVESICPNSTCAGCYATGSNIPYETITKLGAGTMRISTMPDCIDLDNINNPTSVTSQGSSGSFDDDSSAYDFSSCYWVGFHNLIGTVSARTLVCDTCVPYFVGNVSYNIVSTLGLVHLGCTTCNVSNCSAFIPRAKGTCISSITTFAPNTGFNGPNPSACYEPYGCSPPTQVNVNLAVAISVAAFGTVVLLGLLYWRREWARAHALRLRRWGAAKGSIVKLKAQTVGVACWMFYLFLRRNQLLFQGSIQYALYASALVQGGHLVAYILLQPLDIFGMQNLNELGFDSKYIVLDRYEQAFDEWKLVALATFIASTAFTALVALIRVRFVLHTYVLRLAAFLPMFSFLVVYLIYPTFISFKYLIDIDPSSNPYLHDHSDTVSSFQTMLGDGLSGIAVAFLTNQSLLIFSAFAVGALASGYMQFEHENLVLDAFLSIFCAMIPFIVMIPVLVLYHAISDHSLVWVFGWVDLMVGLVCGIGFLYLKVHDKQFRKQAVVHRRFHNLYLVFGFLFLICGLVFACVTLYVESTYELVSATYLFSMILAGVVMAFTFCFIMRSTKAFVINPAREDLPVKLFHNPRDHIIAPPRLTAEELERQRNEKSWFQRITLGAFDSEESFRLFCLVLGIPLMIYVIIDDYRVYLSTTARDMFASFVDTYNDDDPADKLVWPTGPTVLDPCFVQYDYVRKLKMWFLLFSAIMYTLGGLCHVGFHFSGRKNRNKTSNNSKSKSMSNNNNINSSSSISSSGNSYSRSRTTSSNGGPSTTAHGSGHDDNGNNAVSAAEGRRARWLRASELFMFTGVLFTVACVIVVSTPDYLSLIDVHSIVPTCGPDFDRFVSSSVNLGIGLVQTLISVLQTAGIILSFLPTFNRVLYTRIRMLRLLEPPSAFLSVKEMNLRNICVGIAFMSVFITSLPMLVLRQVSADNDTAALSATIFAFWLLPGLWLKCLIRLNNPTVWYVGYVWVYFACALGILAAVMKDQLNSFLRTYFTDPLFYLTVMASICISSVVIGDALRLMFGNFEIFDRVTEEIAVVDRDEDDDRAEGVFGEDDENHRLLGSMRVN